MSKTKFSINIQNVFTAFQNNPDATICECIGNLVCAEPHEQEIISVAIGKWMRNLIYGEHLRHHHAFRAINKNNPVEVIRHVGNEHFRGMLKHIDPEFAEVAIRHQQLTDRYLTFFFLEWAKKKNPSTKLKFSLPEKLGRRGLQDKYRAGHVFSELLGNMHLYRKGIPLKMFQKIN